MKNCKGIFVGFALLIAISSCGERDVEGELRDHIAENARYDVNQFVLEKLEQNRIVMLADAGHGVRLYLQSVIGILNHWLDTNIARAGSGDPICRNVILVLELDSLWVEAVEEYGESNDPDDVLYIGHLATEIFTTAKLEFYLDLGDLRRRIDEYNQSCSQDQPLNLSLFGPEKPIDMDNWSAEKREQFFVYERDEYSSQRLTAHLEQHPESRALVFYGNAHL
ncbi:MAG: hypothetical protein GY867_07495, partial [bacterium]|nr:hypothetical protein [bacterium]